IQKELADERAESGFNSYGFATNQEKRATVPDLRFNSFDEDSFLVH
ncbi:TPA: type I-F CRISPR-associated endoribonuclease Cas6/Csy4, partial [Vibrio cholerae]